MEDIHFTFRGLESSEGLKNYSREKIAKLQKYLRAPLTADAVLSTERHLHKVEFTVKSGGDRFAAHHESEDMYASIDLVVDKLDRQVRDAKDAIDDRKKHGGVTQLAGKE